MKLFYKAFFIPSAGRIISVEGMFIVMATKMVIVPAFLWEKELIPGSGRTGGRNITGTLTVQWKMP